MCRRGALSFLAAQQSVDQVYNVTIDDGHGQVGRDVTVTFTNPIRRPSPLLRPTAAWRATTRPIRYRRTWWAIRASKASWRRGPSFRADSQ